MSLIKNANRVAQHSIRQITTTTVARGDAKIAEGYLQLKNIQAKFQKPDGKPVFLKGGVTDKIMYQITMGLSLVGLGGIGKLLWDLSWPKTE